MRKMYYNVIILIKFFKIFLENITIKKFLKNLKPIFRFFVNIFNFNSFSYKRVWYLYFVIKNKRNY